MLIKMTQTRYGTEDGYMIRTYEAGHVYFVSEALACWFFREGWAELMEKYYD